MDEWMNACSQCNACRRRVALGPARSRLQTTSSCLRSRPEAHPRNHIQAPRRAHRHRAGGASSRRPEPTDRPTCSRVFRPAAEDILGLRANPHPDVVILHCAASPTSPYVPSATLVPTNPEYTSAPRLAPPQPSFDRLVPPAGSQRRFRATDQLSILESRAAAGSACCRAACAAAYSPWQSTHSRQGWPVLTNRRALPCRQYARHVDRPRARSATASSIPQAALNL